MWHHNFNDILNRKALCVVMQFVRITLNRIEKRLFKVIAWELTSNEWLMYYQP